MYDNWRNRYIGKIGVSMGATPGSISCSVETSSEIAPAATDSQSLTQAAHEGGGANHPEIKLVYFS